MKKLITAALLLTATTATILAQNEHKNPVNRLGVQITGMYSSTGQTYFVDNKENSDAMSSHFQITPEITVPVYGKYAVNLGYNLKSYHSDDHSTDNMYKQTEKGFLSGPSLSVVRYCDPCWSEEDCLRFFGFVGVDLDYMSGNTESTNTYNNFTTTEKGTLKKSIAGIRGGALYKIAPDIYATGSLGILNYAHIKTTTNKDEPQHYNTSGKLGLLNSVNLGVRYNF